MNIAKLWTCIVDNKKQTSNGLKKIVHDATMVCAQAMRMIQNENEFLYFLFFQQFHKKIFNTFSTKFVFRFFSLESYSHFRQGSRDQKPNDQFEAN